MPNHAFRATLLLAAAGLCAASCRTTPTPPSANPGPNGSRAVTPTARPTAPRVATATPTTAPVATDRAARPPIHRPPPVLDVRRGTGSFPLGPQPIDSPSHLAAALSDGYHQRLDNLNDQDNTFTVTGHFPALQSLAVDVSGSRVKPSYRPARLDKAITGERELTVAHLAYTAEPLFYDAAPVRAKLVADDARLAVLRDAKGDRGLVLLGARAGRMDFRITSDALEQMLVAGSRQGGGGGSAAGFALQRAHVTFTSDDPRSLTGTLTVRASWLLIPMSFSVHGRVTADPRAGTLTYSDLAATGHDPGGQLAASFINPALKRMNAQTQPMVAFGDTATHVTDVRFAAQDGVSLTVEFGH